jgi:hypothetical protein
MSAEVTPRRFPPPWTGLAPFHVIGPFEFEKCSILNRLTSTMRDRFAA